MINASRYEEKALALLFKPLSKDLNAGEGQAKKALLDILAALRKSNPLTASFYTLFYSILFIRLQQTKGYIIHLYYLLLIVFNYDFYN